MGLTQTTVSEASRRAMVRDVHGGPGCWPPGGGWKGAAPSCLRKFCILRAKYA